MIKEALSRWLKKRGCEFVGSRWCGDNCNVWIYDDYINIWDYRNKRYVGKIRFADPDLFKQLEVWFK